MIIRAFNKAATSFFVLCMLFLASNIILPSPRIHAQPGQTRSTCTEESNAFFGFPTWYKYLNPQNGPNGCELDSLRTGEGELDPYYFLKIAAAVFEIGLRIAGYVAIGFVIWGGFQYILSRGEPDKISGAQTTIVNALAGLSIAIAAVIIVNVVGGSLQ